MAKQVEFFFDYGSPFSYLADTQLEALAKRTGAQIVYRPVLLGAIFKETANSSPISVPAKRTYVGIELQRWAERYGVPFQVNQHFPFNTLRLMRGAIVAQQLGVFAAYHRVIFPAFWAEGTDLRDPAVFREVLSRRGLDADAIAAAIQEPAVKDRLRENTDEAVRRGAFGAPTFFVGEEMFWGNDRLDFVEEALRRAA
jgi:2-hydroxychromene-2-carboxylate isomerase